MIEKYRDELNSLIDAINIELTSDDLGVENVLLCGLACQIPYETLSTIRNSLPEAEEFSIRFATDFYGSLREDLFASIVADFPNKEAHISAYTTTIKAKITSVAVMVSNIKHNREVVRQYLPRLRSLKRQSIKIDRWGDQDHSEWDSVLADFSSQKMQGAEWEDLFKNAVDSIAAHLEYTKQNCTLAKLTGEIFEHEISSQNEFDMEDECITGEDFERKIKSLIESEYPAAIVELTPKSGDHGADLIVCIDSTKIAIQAKYYSNPVGNSAVQEIYSAKDFYGADYAVVVTSSSYTAAATTAADKLNVILAHEETILTVIDALLD